ncbi:MAG: hypothetical protein LUI07_07955 [Lachnospiraceae bacterium]|nr:hypothetical protein [Lachnospiraceae bacterium]
MTDAEKQYQAIIHLDRPEDPAFFRRHPRMSLQNRAKIFAPFAALRGHGERLDLESGRLLRSIRPELSDEEAMLLNEKMAKLKKGMRISLTRFLPDSDEASTGYLVSLTGIVLLVDITYKALKLDAGETGEKGAIETVIQFEDILDLTIDTPISQ